MLSEAELKTQLIAAAYFKTDPTCQILLVIFRSITSGQILFKYYYINNKYIR